MQCALFGGKPPCKIQCITIEDENNQITIARPEQRKRQPRIGIEDFGELVRSDTSQTHNFFYDIVFKEE